MILNILLALLFAQNIAFAQEIPTSVAIWSSYYNQNPYIIMDIISCEGFFGEVKDSPTNDVGPMQINLIHKPEAIKMGLNLRLYDDNVHYGVYLMSKEGLKPWNASKACWSKHPISGGPQGP
jgi:hypothetical protein